MIINLANEREMVHEKQIKEERGKQWNSPGTRPSVGGKNCLPNGKSWNIKKIEGEKEKVEFAEN